MTSRGIINDSLISICDMCMHSHVIYRWWNPISSLSHVHTNLKFTLPNVYLPTIERTWSIALHTYFMVGQVNNRWDLISSTWLHKSHFELILLPHLCILSIVLNRSLITNHAMNKHLGILLGYQINFYHETAGTFILKFSQAILVEKYDFEFQ